MSAALEVADLLRALSDAGIEYVLVGGLAVNAYGVIRSTRDADICPSPERENLERLAGLLKRLEARQLGLGAEGFSRDELPLDPTQADDLAQGGNFRLDTRLGGLDLMQWLPGIDAEQAYETLAARSVTAHAFGVTIRVCSLEDLRAMKRAAGRPQDLQDLRDLDAAHEPRGN